MRSIPFCLPRAFLVMVGVLSMVMALAACGGGGDSAGTGDTSGDVVVSLTDAEGDFGSYTVDVLSLELTKANGAVVSALPMATRIDFAQYTDMTEFLTAATVPSGVYVSATLTLDYTDADIWVENADGDLIQVDTIVDADGLPLTQVEITVQLEDRNHLLIAPGIPAHLQLDFDLKATNSVTFDGFGVPTVMVEPYLVADVDFEDWKINRLRGLLDAVAVDTSSFSVFIRPCYAALNGSHHRFGRLNVHTEPTTVFDVDDEVYQGQDGILAMDRLAPTSAVVVVGDLAFHPLRFKARHVYAGTSVPWGDKDIVSGTVTARLGDVLTVKGATLIRSDGSIIFNNQATVTVGESTVVTRQLSMDPLLIEDISVGQRVRVIGTLTDADPLRLAMDATEGHVRLRVTAVRGSVTQVNADHPVSQLNLAVQSINHCRVEVYDFSGTGVDADNDADAGSYEINTASMDLSNYGVGDPVKALGFVQPFGAAPQDFNAHSLVNVADVRAFLKVNWEPASDSAFEQLSAQGITLNLDGTDQPYHVFRSWILTDLAGLEQSTTVVSHADGRGVFVIHVDGVVQVFLTFEAYIDELRERLDEGWQVEKIRARGNFDDASATLTADLIDVQLQ